MHSHLKAKTKGVSDLFNIFKGVRQGGLTFPAFFNNSVSAAQCSAEYTCIYGGIDVSLFTYADDVLNLSCTFLEVRELFLSSGINISKSV